MAEVLHHQQHSTMHGGGAVLHSSLMPVIPQVRTCLQCKWQRPPRPLSWRIPFCRYGYLQAWLTSSCVTLC
jgi:hypothetical protein